MNNQKLKVSILWVVVMFNMAFADIFGMIFEGTDAPVSGPGGMEITSVFILVASFLVEVPIAMIFLTQILKVKANRVVNIIASLITIVFVVGGGSSTAYYLFFAAIEVISMLLIIWYVWKWKEVEA